MQIQGFTWKIKLFQILGGSYTASSLHSFNSFVAEARQVQFSKQKLDCSLKTLIF